MTCSRGPEQVPDPQSSPDTLLDDDDSDMEEMLVATGEGKLPM